VVDLLPEPAVCYTLGLPDARARYVDDAVSAGRDAGVADVDAGSSDAGSDADAGADGGADGGAVQRLVQVRVELLFPTAPTSLGQAVPRTAGVAVLEVGGAGLSATLLLSIPEGGAASVELPLVCQRQTYQLRVDLQLQPRSVEVSVTFG
jgi:hypothetical protein